MGKNKLYWQGLCKDSMLTNQQCHNEHTLSVMVYGLENVDNVITTNNIMFLANFKCQTTIM